MLSMNNIQETLQMFQDNKLDIRTVTMGISLMDCIDSDIERSVEKVYKKITEKAKNLIEVVEGIESEYGIPIIHKRISVTPIALLAGATESDETFKLLRY